MQLGGAVEADGRWRLFAFAPCNDDGEPDGPIDQLCNFLGTHADSPIGKFTPEGESVDAVIDLRAVFQKRQRDLEFAAMPSLLRPLVGELGLTDYEKLFCVDPKAGDIFDMRGIDREHGCLVVVRPDQHVAHVVPLDHFEALSRFFSGFMLEPDRHGLLPTE